jgi:hypothetical protein
LSSFFLAERAKEFVAAWKSEAQEQTAETVHPALK